jgi:hypothetical protein
MPMRKVNLKDVQEQERKLPKGKFGRMLKDISIALGRDRVDATEAEG